MRANFSRVFFGALLLNFAQVPVQLTIIRDQVPHWQTDQDQLSLQRFSAVVLMVDSLAVLAGFHHFSMQQGADIGTLLQVNLHQSGLLRLQQQERQPRTPQQEKRQRYPQKAQALGGRHIPSSNTDKYTWKLVKIYTSKKKIKKKKTITS